MMTPDRGRLLADTSTAGEDVESATVEPDVLIVGAGLAGIGMAITLLKEGRPNFVVLEKASRIGGTWRENTYPGCACDVASVMYSYSFAPNPYWSRMYAEQPEILDYIDRVAREYSLDSYIEFDTEAVSYVFDEFTDRWRVETRGGKVYAPRVVVAAHGALHNPEIPHFDGDADFQGAMFHSARWDEGVRLEGKRVAVIGTGSSAAQFIPRIAESAAHVEVFQRTAHWVLPKADRPIGPVERWLFARVPFLQFVYRNVAYWTHEVPVLAFMNPRLVKLLRAAALRHLRKQVPDPELRERLTPTYEIGCKRILLSNDYFPALQRDNVTLVAQGVTDLTSTGVRTADGAVHAADVVILGTGFSTNNRCADENIVGRAGVSIQEAWRDGMQAYLGTTVAGFPNMFMIMGPNSGGGAQSILFVIETQIRYIVRCLDMMTARGATRLEVRDDVQRDFNSWLHGRLSRSVWNAGGCTSWFLDHTGRNRQSWPGTGTSYWRRLRTPDPEAFRLSSATVSDRG
ncbi:flavin-containing monooxygenase [Rhodococcus sp. NPDC003318]|uniref:flavin-containing monooxygenase n=1 Tax=Rhodococcus sp. NPDC003318 TaxID=3364503 RepID=UPI003673E5D0